MCVGDAALCQITLTTCLRLRQVCSVILAHSTPAVQQQARISPVYTAMRPDNCDEDDDDDDDDVVQFSCCTCVT